MKKYIDIRILNINEHNRLLFCTGNNLIYKEDTEIKEEQVFWKATCEDSRISPEERKLFPLYFPSLGSLFKVGTVQEHNPLVLDLIVKNVELAKSTIPNSFISHRNASYDTIYGINVSEYHLHKINDLERKYGNMSENERWLAEYSSYMTKSLPVSNKQPSVWWDRTLRLDNTFRKEITSAFSHLTNRYTNTQRSIGWTNEKWTVEVSVDDFFNRPRLVIYQKFAGCQLFEEPVVNVLLPDQNISYIYSQLALVGINTM